MINDVIVYSISVDGDWSLLSFTCISMTINNSQICVFECLKSSYNRIHQIFFSVGPNKPGIENSGMVHEINQYVYTIIVYMWECKKIGEITMDRCNLMNIERLHMTSFLFKQWYFQVAKLWTVCMATGRNLPHFC